ncbi:MAG: biotin--[acetyl-CoA-carboxylase] ligase [Actinomycetota bacterium]
MDVARPEDAARTTGQAGSNAGEWADLSRPPLHSAMLRRALVGVNADGSQSPWTSLDVLPSVGSTNTELARRYRSGSAGLGAVLIAEQQDAGRGRQARTWVAPSRSSLTMSIVLQPAMPMTRWGWFPLIAGLAIKDALVQVCHVPALLKWPNDILINGRKVAGLLAEVVSTAQGVTAVVLGIGINVSQGESELPAPEATSLMLAAAATTDRDTVLRAALRAIDARHRQWTAADDQENEVSADYRKGCDTLQRFVRVHLPQGETVMGVATDIDDDGRLVVTKESGFTQAFAAADVEHVRSAQAPNTA